MALSLAMLWHIAGSDCAEATQRAGSIPHTGRDGVVHGQFHPGSQPSSCCSCSSHGGNAVRWCGRSSAPPSSSSCRPTGTTSLSASLPPGFSAIHLLYQLFRRDNPRRVHAAFPGRVVALHGGTMGATHRAISADPVAAGLRWFAVIARPEQSPEAHCPGRAAACHARAGAGNEA